MIVESGHDAHGVRDELDAVLLLLARRLVVRTQRVQVLVDLDQATTQ